MSTPIRQLVTDELVKKLQSILVVNGYSADFGERVHDYFALPEKAPAPACFYLASDEEVESQAGDTLICSALPIVGLIDHYSGSDPTRRGNEMLADAQRAINQPFNLTVPSYYGSGGTVEIVVNVTEIESVIRAGDAIGSKVWVNLKYKLQYSRHLFDPAKA